MSSYSCRPVCSGDAVTRALLFCVRGHLRWLVLILLTTLAGPVAWGHVLGQGYVFLRSAPDHVVAKLQLPVGSLEDALGIRLTATGKAGAAALEQALEVISGYVDAHYGLRVDGQPLPPELVGYGLFDTPIEQFVELRYRYPLASLEGAEIRYAFFFDFDADHRGVLLLQPPEASDADEGGEAIAVFAPGRDWQPASTSGDAEPVEFRPASGQKWVGMGAGLGLILILAAAALWLARRKSRA